MQKKMTFKRATLVGTLVGVCCFFTYVLALSNWTYWTTYSLLLNIIAYLSLVWLQFFPGFPLLDTFVDACRINALAIAFTIVYILEESFEKKFLTSDKSCEYLFSSHFAVHFAPILIYLIHDRATDTPKGDKKQVTSLRKARVIFSFLCILFLVYTGSVDFAKKYALFARDATGALAVYLSVASFLILLFCFR